MAGVRKDLYGFIDIIAIDESTTLAIQSTSYPNHSARMKKALAEPNLKTWLKDIHCSREFQVWSWRKPKGRWLARKEEVVLIGGDLVTREVK